MTTQSRPTDQLGVPDVLMRGTPLSKVSHKKKKRCTFSIDADQGNILYESRKDGVVPISAIRDIRTGSDVRHYLKQFHMQDDDQLRWITITYLKGSEYKMLHLVADDAYTFNLWRETLVKMTSLRQALMQGLGQASLRQDMWFKQYWKRANALRPDERLDFDEILHLAKQLNSGHSTEELRAMFKEADTKQVGHLDLEGFKRFAVLLKRRPDIEKIYKGACGPNSQQLDLAALQAFMQQRQKANGGEAEAIFEKYAQTKAENATKTMDLESFTSFLLSEDNAVFNPRNNEVHQDMNRPISEYYISSSHNTYLVGHQLVGLSTVEGYIRALLLGCRSVELDIYDGDDDEEPMVYHGKTFTSQVSLREVCEAIKRYAFIVSKYPLIISAEVHCSLPKQDQLYQIMVDVFGDSLIRAPVNGRPKIEKLPSPEEMKEKILLKAKNLFIANGVEQVRQEPASKLEAGPNEPVALDVDSASSDSSSSDSTGVVDEIKGVMSKLRRRKKTEKPKMSFALASLLVYTVGVKCRGLDKTQKYSPEHIFSLSESAAGKLCGREEFVQHTQNHLVRVYPRGTRVSSSNYLPHVFWAGGAQLVAINVQTFASFGLMMAWSFFLRNGKAGYILKPDPLRVPDPTALRQKKKYQLRCEIISGQHLPAPRDSNGNEKYGYSAVDPYVQVSLHIPDWSLAESTAANTKDSQQGKVLTFATKVVKNNGFNPQWDESHVFTLDCAAESMLDLIFLHFEVKQKHDDEDDDPIAQYCIPLGQLRQGYRHLPLHDSQLSQFLYSTLFIHTSLQTITS